MDWERKWFVHFIAGKTQPVLFDQSHNIGTIDGKMDVSVLEEKPSFRDRQIARTVTSVRAMCTHRLSRAQNYVHVNQSKYL